MFFVLYVHPNLMWESLRVAWMPPSHGCELLRYLNSLRKQIFGHQTQAVTQLSSGRKAVRPCSISEQTSYLEQQAMKSIPYAT